MTIGFAIWKMTKYGYTLPAIAVFRRHTNLGFHHFFLFLRRFFKGEQLPAQIVRDCFFVPPFRRPYMNVLEILFYHSTYAQQGTQVP